MHIISMRMAHGESLYEACYTAGKAVMAAVNGEISNDNSTDTKKELHLDGYDTWVYMKWHDKDQAWGGL